MRITSIVAILIAIAAVGVAAYGDEGLELTTQESLLLGIIVANAAIVLAVVGTGGASGGRAGAGTPAVYVEWETAQGWEVYPSVPLMLAGGEEIRQRVRLVNRGTAASGPVEANIQSELPVEIEFEPSVATDDVLTRSFLSDGVKLRWRHPSGVFPGEVTMPIVLRLSKLPGSQGVRGVRAIAIECRDDESTIVTRARCEVTV